MATTGKVKTLFSDKEKTEALFPRTKVSAVSDVNGVGLDAILDSVLHIGEAAGEAATVPLNADTLGGKLPEDYAPAGFGLGEAWGGEIEDCNDAIANGWFNINASVKNIPTTPDGTTFPYSTMLVTARYDFLWQEVYSSLYGAHYKFTRSSTDRGATWTEWCCDNPPMMISAEYRTTERFHGKAVYCKSYNFGSLPVDGTGSINHGLSQVSIIRVTGFRTDAVGTVPLPYHIGNVHIYLTANNTQILVTTNVDVSDVNAIVTLYYTKD